MRGIVIYINENIYTRTKHHVDRQSGCEVMAIFVLSKMAVSRHVGFYPTANSAIRSADPENPSIEQNMEWIGCTVCEIFAFKLYCDLETGVWGHSRSPKAAPFDRAHTTLCSSSIVNMPQSLLVSETAAYWSKIATPLHLGVKPSDLSNDPW